MGSPIAFHDHDHDHDTKDTHAPMPSTLAARLDRIRAGVEAQAPAAALTVMHRATADLRDSGIMGRIPRVGDTPVSRQ